LFLRERVGRGCFFEDGDAGVDFRQESVPHASKGRGQGLRLGWRSVGHGARRIPVE
jgi:hypothetical protein